MSNIYNIKEFSIHSGYDELGDALYYQPDDQHQPDYPIPIDEVYADTIYFTDEDKYPWRTYYGTPRRTAQFKFYDVPRSVATAIEDALTTLEGTFWMMLGTYGGTAITFQKMFLDREIQFEETDVGNYNFDLKLNFYDSEFDLLLSPEGWGTSPWGTNWGF